MHDALEHTRVFCRPRHKGGMPGSCPHLLFVGLDLALYSTQEIKRAMPPNLDDPSPFEMALAGLGGEHGPGWLSQRLLLDHLLQTLGPNRVVFFPPGEGPHPIPFSISDE